MRPMALLPCTALQDWLPMILLASGAVDDEHSGGQLVNNLSLWSLVSGPLPQCDKGKAPRLQISAGFGGC